MTEHLEKANTLLRDQQMAIKQKNGEEPFFFQTGDLELFQNNRKRCLSPPLFQHTLFFFDLVAVVFWVCFKVATSEMIWRSA